MLLGAEYDLCTGAILALYVRRVSGREYFAPSGEGIFTFGGFLGLKSEASRQKCLF